MRINGDNLADGLYDANDLTEASTGVGDLGFLDDFDDNVFEGSAELCENPEGDENEIANYIQNSNADELVNEMGQYSSAEDMEKALLQEGFSIDDPVRLYLKEIGKVSLLGSEAEAELAQTVYDGIQAQAMLDELQKDKAAQNDPAVSEYLETLRKKVEKGQRAKDRLVEANLRLVVSIAKRHSGKGLSFLDLIQEGNLGLLKAAEKFDYRKGYKFSTYATWWIRQSITRAIADQARTIRIPVHMVETIHKVSRASRKLLQEYGREPTSEEIAKEVDMPVDKVREIMKIAMDPVPLETPVGEEDDSQLYDFIEDEDSPSPSDSVSQSMLREQLVSVLHTLTPREEQVLMLRFGLKDGQQHTLEEVGAAFQITRERIRQIEAKALRKLRHPSRSRKLRDYLDN